MKEYNYKELQEIAKANNFPSVGVKKEELIEILSKRDLLPKANVQKDKPIEEEKSKEIEKSEMITVPKDLAHLGLTPLKRITPDEVKISHLVNSENLLSIPREIEERLTREGYRWFFPLDYECGRNMERGCEFIIDKQGNSIKIDAGQCNKSGERMYHIAMKQKIELWERERKLFKEKQKSLEKGIKSGGIVNAKGELVNPEDSEYLKHTSNIRDISMRGGKIS